MSYEFKKLADVESLNEVPEVATVLAEVSGEIKRIPSSGLGGSGIKTAIIKDSGYDEAIVSFSSSAAPSAMVAEAAPEYTYSCLNMTFEEAYETMASGEPLDILGMLTAEGAVNIHGTAFFFGVALTGAPCIGVMFSFGSSTVAELYWSADGLSTSNPNEPK